MDGVRVRLRGPREEDRAAFVALVAGAGPDVDRWIDLGDPQRDFDTMLESREDPRCLKRLLCLRDDDVPIGVLNINEIVRGRFLSAYLGYWIGAAHAGQGLMGEALRLVMRHAFETLGLHRLEANLQPGNEASRALVQRAGFVQEGLSERYLELHGEWRDHERWAITAERWHELG